LNVHHGTGMLSIGDFSIEIASLGNREKHAGKNTASTAADDAIFSLNVHNLALQIAGSDRTRNLLVTNGKMFLKIYKDPTRLKGILQKWGEAVAEFDSQGSGSGRFSTATQQLRFRLARPEPRAPTKDDVRKKKIPISVTVCLRDVGIHLTPLPSVQVVYNLAELIVTGRRMRRLAETLQFRVCLKDHHLAVTTSLRLGRSGGGESDKPPTMVVPFPRLSLLLSYIGHELVDNVNETLADVGIGQATIEGRGFSSPPTLSPSHREGPTDAHVSFAVPSGPAASTSPRAPPLMPAGNAGTAVPSSPDRSPHQQQHQQHQQNHPGSQPQQRQQPAQDSGTPASPAAATTDLMGLFDSTVAIDLVLGAVTLNLTTDTLNQLLFAVTSLQGELQSLSNLAGSIYRAPQVSTPDNAPAAATMEGSADITTTRVGKRRRYVIKAHAGGIRATASAAGGSSAQFSSGEINLRGGTQISETDTILLRGQLHPAFYFGNFQPGSDISYKHDTNLAHFTTTVEFLFQHMTEGAEMDQQMHGMLPARNYFMVDVTSPDIHLPPETIPMATSFLLDFQSAYYALEEQRQHLDHKLKLVGRRLYKGLAQKMPTAQGKEALRKLSVRVAMRNLVIRVPLRAKARYGVFMPTSSTAMNVVLGVDSFVVTAEGQEVALGEFQEASVRLLHLPTWITNEQLRSKLVDTPHINVAVIEQARLHMHIKTPASGQQQQGTGSQQQQGDNKLRVAIQAIMTGIDIAVGPEIGRFVSAILRTTSFISDRISMLTYSDDLEGDNLSKANRQRLFDMINSDPTVRVLRAGAARQGMLVDYLKAAGTDFPVWRAVCSMQVELDCLGFRRSQSSAGSCGVEPGLEPG